jgi:hypothetical protein
MAFSRERRTGSDVRQPGWRQGALARANDRLTAAAPENLASPAAPK